MTVLPTGRFSDLVLTRTLTIAISIPASLRIKNQKLFFLGNKFFSIILINEPVYNVSGALFLHVFINIFPD